MGRQLNQKCGDIEVKIIVCGSRDCVDYNLIEDGILKGLENLGMGITTLVSTNDKGVAKTAQVWAKNHNVSCVNFEADWKNIAVEGAVVKERFNKWKKVNEKYNSKAGAFRDDKMIEFADGLICIDLYTGHNSFLLQKIVRAGLPYYEYNGNTQASAGDFLTSYKF